MATTTTTVTVCSGGCDGAGERWLRTIDSTAHLLHPNPNAKEQEQKGSKWWPVVLGAGRERKSPMKASKERSLSDDETMLLNHALTSLIVHVAMRRQALRGLSR